MTAATDNFFTSFFENMFDPSKYKTAFDPAKYQAAFDFDSALGKNKRHVESATNAQQMIMANMQAIMKRQAEVLQENASCLMNSCKKAPSINSPEKALEEQGNFIKESMTRNLSNFRELMEMAIKAQMEMMDMMSHTINTNLDEHCVTTTTKKDKK